jgi:hypothetical protein
MWTIPSSNGFFENLCVFNHQINFWQTFPKLFFFQARHGHASIEYNLIFKGGSKIMIRIHHHGGWKYWCDSGKLVILLMLKLFVNLFIDRYYPNTETDRSYYELKRVFWKSCYFSSKINVSLFGLIFFNKQLPARAGISHLSFNKNVETLKFVLNGTNWLIYILNNNSEILIICKHHKVYLKWHISLQNIALEYIPLECE